MKKEWTQPKLMMLDSNTIQSGDPNAAYAYEKYVNLSSGCGQYNGSGWPCTASSPAGCAIFVTTSFYLPASGIAASSVAACDQGGGACNPGGGMAAAVAGTANFVCS